jgi:transcriptional regulator with PAS, ATPase and Fis domain
MEEIITFEELHKKLTKKALKRYKGNVTEAAKAMGISRRKLKRWMLNFNINYDKKN